MKYISVVILLAFMGWTWCLATSERAFSLEDYKRVEAGAEQDIQAFIERKYPDVHSGDVYCNKMYTERTEHASDLIVRFRCQAQGHLENGEVSEQIFTGYLNLHSEDGFTTWNEVGGEIKQPEVIFEKGTHVSIKDGGEETTTQKPVSAPAPKKKAHP